MSEAAGAGSIGDRDALKEIQPLVISLPGINLAPADDHILGDPKAVFTRSTLDWTPDQVVTHPEALTARRAADQNHWFG